EFSSFRPSPRDQSDIVVVRSDRYTVDEPSFRSFVSSLSEAGARTGKIGGADVYYATHDPSLVSRDKHALMIPLSIADTSDVPQIESIVGRANATAGFHAWLTGNTVRDHDFDQLSQHDLKSGELEFGLPAALIILVLVFGAVVAGLVPILLAILAIVAGLGLVAI